MCVFAVMCPGQLWVSEDLGDTWTLLGGNVTRYSWRVLDSDMEDKTSVYFEVDVNGERLALIRGDPDRGGGCNWASLSEGLL